MLYCAVHSVTPVCCTKHCAVCSVPLLQHSLYGDHMYCLQKWTISPKLYFPYKQVLPAVCPIRHCLDRSVSVNSCHQNICICKAKFYRILFLGNLCVFVPVAQGVYCGIYWVFLKVCRNAIRPISPAILCNILIMLHTHTPCHISLCSTAVHGHDTNCIRTKLHVTPVSYRDSRTD